jgi:predicted membrane protein
MSENDIINQQLKRKAVWVAAFIVATSLFCGLLMGALMLSAPHNPFIVAMGDIFVTGGFPAFDGPGGAWLALAAGLMWGLCFILAGAFPYTAWLIYRANDDYKNMLMKQKMEAYYGAPVIKQSE